MHTYASTYGRILERVYIILDDAYILLQHVHHTHDDTSVYVHACIPICTQHMFVYHLNHRSILLLRRGRPLESRCAAAVMGGPLRTFLAQW